MDLSARLGAWRVLPGDPGDLLRLALPIVAGGVAGGSGDVIELTGATAVVTVSLHLLPGEVGRPRDLAFDLTRAGRPGDVPVPGVVTLWRSPARRRSSTGSGRPGGTSS
ncbi:TULIP family P47-like protein [Microbispora sp. KK1-11]|uniref:TULIP family P47-like protein n=1 Tax=Microbispora sp. KK1-11 TaxID=2053005 RepID=UPI00163C5CE5|nr:TULIP family P47-like protein [Microbispora sp. KK1-11]